MKWNEKLGDYLIDVSKYTITGVVLTAFFNDIANKTALYSVGVFVSMCALYVGIRISDKDEDKIKIKRRNSYGRLYRSYGNWNPLRIVHFVLYDKARQGVDAQKQYAVANRLKKTCLWYYLHSHSSFCRS